MVLDYHPPLLPVSIDISGVDLSESRIPAMVADVDVLPLERETLFDGGDLLGLICPELGVSPLDPGADVEDEWPTPVGSPSPVMVVTVPLPAPSSVDMELEHVFLEVGVLPAMVTPIVEPVGESAMESAAGYPVPPIPELSVMVTDTLGGGFPCRDGGGESSEGRVPFGPDFAVWVCGAGGFCDPRIMTVRHLDWRPWTNICLGVLRRRWGSLGIPLCFRVLSVFMG